MTPEEKLIVDRLKATYADVDEMQTVFDIVTKTLALREAEIEGLNAEWHAEIERSKRYAAGYEKVIAVRDAEIERLKELCGRAADALKSEHEGRPVLPDKHPLGCSICNLIAELRKAATE